MPNKRPLVFVNDYIYHVFNRGVERRVIFDSPKDYRRFQETINYYRHSSIPISFSQCIKLEKTKRIEFLESVYKSPPIVDILAYCLMPNHFHFLLRQKTEHGIANFISHISNSYSRYFNTRHHRVGHLFQGVFKAVFIETEEQMTHISRYIHLNPAVASLIENEEIASYPWTSLASYLKPNKTNFVETKTISNYFANPETYLSFLNDHLEYAKQLDALKHLNLD